MKYFAPLLFSVLLMFPASVSAATLTQNQINAIISVLMAFGVDQTTINAVSVALAPVAPETSISNATSTYQPPQPAPDTNPPVVNLQKLTDKWKQFKSFDTGVWGVLGLEEWNYVTDNSKVTGEALNVFVQWSVDGAPIEQEREINWMSKSILDTTKYQNGKYTLTLKATDAAGNSSSASITITIKNPN